MGSWFIMCIQQILEPLFISSGATKTIMLPNLEPNDGIREGGLDFLSNTKYCKKRTDLAKTKLVQTRIVQFLFLDRNTVSVFAV